jgi:hypothetical protein
MFVSHLEGFDLLMTPVTCRIFLWDCLPRRKGIGEIENQRKKAKSRNEEHFLEHRSTSSQDKRPTPRWGLRFFSLFYCSNGKKEKLFASNEQGDGGPSEKDNQEYDKLFDQFGVHKFSFLFKGWRGFVFLPKILY